MSSWQQEGDPAPEEGGLGGVDDEDLEGGPGSGPAVELDDEDVGGTGDEAS
ncbi:MAG TPA: hypothetical protein VNB86_06395 [Gaiellaceae bacterium]|nr:hypothetical protein [Gaiellaceae bacterium]